jgi:hypothetical protein
LGVRHGGIHRVAPMYLLDGGTLLKFFGCA